jgi:hypothetical protein
MTIDMSSFPSGPSPFSAFRLSTL